MLCTTAMKGGVDQLVSDVFLQNVFSPQKKLQLQFDSLQEVVGPNDTELLFIDQVYFWIALCQSLL